MPIYLSTRGRVTDYAFLGNRPQERWWSAFSSVTSFERSTLIVHSDGQQLRFILSGIPSRRRDRVNTAIRYTLVIEGAPGGAPECQAAQALASAVLNPVESVWAARLGEALDSQFDEPVMESLLLHQQQTQETAFQVQRALEAVLQSLATPASGRAVAVQDTATPDTWACDATSPTGRRLAEAAVGALCAGQRTGLVARLNLVATLQEASSVAQGHASAVLLLDEPDPPLGREPRPLRGDDSLPPASPPSSRAATSLPAAQVRHLWPETAPSTVPLKLRLALVVAGLVVVLFWWLSQLVSTSH